ncbi:MAG: hypothetical protein MJZ34_13350 [Paludibacteraceae bacterium]|nr:hypothetical protein [Paludibacteraceae bacterium]
MLFMFFSCGRNNRVSQSEIKPNDNLIEGWYMHFTDSLHGVVFGDRAYAFYTKDGGLTWVEQEIMEGYRFYPYSKPFVDNDNIYSYIYNDVHAYSLLRYNIKDGIFSLLECKDTRPCFFWKQNDTLKLMLRDKNKKKVVFSLNDSLQVINKTECEFPKFSLNLICIDDTFYSCKRFSGNKNSFLIWTDSVIKQCFEMKDPCCIEKLSNSRIIIVDSDSQNNLYVYEYDIEKKSLIEISRLSGYEGMDVLLVSNDVLVGFVSKHIYYNIAIYSLDGGHTWEKLGEQVFYRNKCLRGNSLLINCGGLRIKKFDFIQ